MLYLLNFAYVTMIIPNYKHCRM